MSIVGTFQSGLLETPASFHTCSQCSGSVMASQKPKELSNLEYGSGGSRAVGKREANCISAKAGVCSVSLKNNRAEDMFILLLDANKTVNSIITSVLFQFP